MELKELLKIRNGIERFDKVLDDSIKLAKTIPGYKATYDNQMHGVGDISGTQQCGHLKREYLSLKFNLNKLI